METKEGPYTQLIAIGTIVLVGLTGLGIYLSVAAGRHRFPFEPTGSAAAAASTSTAVISRSPKPSISPEPSPVARPVAYLDASAPTSGGPVGRGLASVNGQSFSRSIWLPFAESCCGSAQSVTYSVPSGYRQFTGMLAEQEAPGLPSGYTMLFSIAVNGVQVLDNRQVLLGDPPVPFQVRCQQARPASDQCDG